MKSPLWILNSALLLIFLAVVSFVIFNQKKTPARKSLRPEAPLTSAKKDVSKINIARIYENDLFNTYVKETPQQPEVQKGIVPIPQPPSLQPTPVPQPARLEFLPPLPISLKGIIFTNNDLENRAIIANNKTKQESLYKIGDKVEDADIIHISRHKVIFVRSNGQQETVFITPTDAQEDLIFSHDKPWSTVVKKLTDTTYAVDPKTFTKRITSLAQFIDMLDVTTAFSKGKSIGCRIGMLAPQSIGPSLGLNPGDIVIEVNAVPTTTTQDRMTVYKMITEMSVGSEITVKYLRNDQEFTMTYVLQKLTPDTTEQPAYGEKIIEKNNELIEAAQTNPMIDEIKKQDKSAMLRHGGRSAMIQRLPQ